MVNQVRAFRAVVSGRVQGVGFRYSAYHRARELRLSGWVKNCFDGTVETVFSGSQESCQSYIKFLHQGPAMSWVESVDIQEVSSFLEQGFSIR